MAPRLGGGERKGGGVPKGILGQHWDGGEACGCPSNAQHVEGICLVLGVLVVADPNFGLVVNLHNLRRSLVGWGRYVRLP